MTTDIGVLLRPLSARSVIASALLGTHPPRLEGRLLVALAEAFDIAPGTARVALSRMVDRGELANLAGSYELSGSLLDRQRRQDLGRSSDDQRRWDGSWEQIIVVESGRSATERHALRRGLTAARLGEVREGVWMRPANLDRGKIPPLPDEVAGHVLHFTVTEWDLGDTETVIERIFETRSWVERADVLVSAMKGHADGLAATFMVASAALQHLTRDPLLPPRLFPANWPAELLRDTYASYERDLQTELRSFFAVVN